MERDIFHRERHLKERTGDAEGHNLKYALEVQNHAKTTALLADEKAAKKELQTAMTHKNELHDAKVKYLEDRIGEFKTDKDKYMGKVLGPPHAPQASQSVRNNRQESHDYTPPDAIRDEPRYRASGSAHSPSR